MSSKQLLAEIDRGINALQKARVLCLKAETATPTSKVAAGKTATATKAPAKKAARTGVSDETRAKIAAAQQKRWAKIRRAKKRADKAALTIPAAV
jgi:hypothetical protein